jgi:outer membrane protein TolC
MLELVHTCVSTENSVMSLLPSLLVTALLAAPATSAAPTAPSVSAAPAAERLTFTEVLRQSVKKNRDLKRAGLDLASAVQDIRAAKGLYDTQLDAGIKYRRSESSSVDGVNIQQLKSQALEYSLSASQKLPTGGTVSLGFATSYTKSLSQFVLQGVEFDNESATWDTALTLTVTHPLLKGIGLDVNLAAIRQARLARDALRWTVRAKARAVVRDLLKAYLDVVDAQAAVRVQQEAVVQARRDLKRVEALIDAGRMAPTELVDYQIVVAQQQRVLFEAQTNWMQHSLVLRSKMGLRIKPGRLLVSTMLPRDPFGNSVPTPQRAAQATLKSSQALRAALKELKIRKISLVTAARDTWPKLDLSGSIGPQGRGDTFAGAHKTLFKGLGMSVGLTFSYLVGSRAAKAALSKARIDLRRKEVDLDELRQTLVAEATKTVALLRLEQRLARTAGLEERLATLRLANERKKYVAGRSSAYVLLQIQNDLIKARHKAFSARITVFKRRVELAALTGDLLARWGLKLTKEAKLRVSAR